MFFSSSLSSDPKSNSRALRSPLLGGKGLEDAPRLTEWKEQSGRQWVQVTDREGSKGGSVVV